MKNKLILSVMLIALSLQTGCLYAARYDGPYHGKVVDLKTREPIEGAAVLGTWSVLHVSLAGGYHTYYEARETITDKNGEFVIPGQGLRIMSNLESMSVLIFKAGYSYEQAGTWDTLKIGLYAKDRIKWEGDMPIFPIKKLTLEERKQGSLPPYPPTEAQSDRKASRFMEEIKRERIEQGLKVTD